MKLSIMTAALSALAAPTLVAADISKGSVVYVFDGSYAAGIDGTIRTDWDEGIMCDRVTVKADLRFRVSAEGLAKADSNCTGPVKEYTYHIHTKWDQSYDQGNSGGYGQCAKALTGNHYDPNKACGPASEYADTPECAPKIKNYQCTPDRYVKDNAVCEFGDLSGKLGTLKPNKKGVVKAKWTDSLFPAWKDHKPTWSIVIHAVCGKATPRVACAVGQQFGPKRKHLKVAKSEPVEDDEDYENDDENDDETNEETDEDDDENDDEDEGVARKSVTKAAGEDEDEASDDAGEEADDTEDDMNSDDEDDEEEEVVVKIYVDGAM